MTPDERLISDDNAATLLGTNVAGVAKLCESGALAARWLRIPHLGGGRGCRRYRWFVCDESLMTLLRKRGEEFQPDDHDGRVEPQWPDPPVLYGLLTAADVAELERRRAKFQTQQEMCQSW